MLLIIASVATSIAAPEASPPTLHFDEPFDAHVEHVDVVEEVGTDHVRVAMTFTLTVSGETQRNLEVPIEMPRDAAVIGLTLALGDSKSTARFVWADAARSAYEKIVVVRRDPALLEWIEGTDDHQRLMLHVFPVTGNTPATVTITFITESPVVMMVAPWITVDKHFTATTAPRPMLGFGRQLGAKMSLFAADRVARPEFSRNDGF